jgi:hypothetical protein
LTMTPVNATPRSDFHQYGSFGVTVAEA